MADTVYEFGAKSIDGKDVSLAEWKGKVLLVVNTASRCGFTPQYEGLEKLHKDYRDRGFAVLGFPCNQFANQEPEGEKEIRSFCMTRFNVDFPLFAKVEVNGPGTHPLWAFMKKSAKGGLFGRDVKWNFTKFLVDRQGRVLKRFPPNAEPESLRGEIEALL